MRRVLLPVVVVVSIVVLGVTVSCSSPHTVPPTIHHAPVSVSPSASGPEDVSASPDSLEHRAEIAVVGPHEAETQAAKRPLSPLADSVAQYLVLDPSLETWFLAAGRGPRLLMDLGRIDTTVKTPARRAAYHEAMMALSPIRIGTRVRIRDPWGGEDATVSGYDVWNGRIVATLTLSHWLDSVMVKAEHWRVPVVASATLVDSTVVDTVPFSVRDSCPRDSVSPAMRARVAAVRDSVAQWLHTQELPPFERLVNTLHVTSSQVIGCFGGPRRVALVVDLRAGANEWIRERGVLLDTLGHVTTLRISDYRFKGHDFLRALDADGDGVDDIAARGVTDFAGGTVILKMSGANRLQRLVSGFSWESR